MSRIPLWVLGLSVLLAGCSSRPATPTVAARTPAPAAAPASGPTEPVLAAGVDLEYVDPAVRVQDDTYRHLNGKWLEQFQLPPDRERYGSFTEVQDRTEEQLRTIVLGLASAADATPDAGKLADLYASFMDEAHIDALGLAPLQPTLRAIAQLRSKQQIPALIAHFNEVGLRAPYDVGIVPDARDSTHYAATIAQGGLGMPDRDYYLKDDPKLVAVRTAYREHIERMLTLAGVRSARREARAILALETRLAAGQWTRVENRDPVKTYNKFQVADLVQLTPDLDWSRWLAATSIAGKVDKLIVSQPSYLKAFDRIVAETPLSTWRSYFRWHAIEAAAPYLSRPFVEEDFAFTGRVLRGVPENRPRWKRALSLLDETMGEALGRLYVARYFPPAYKARMQALVHELILAYRLDLDHLDWMSETTREGARAKLDKLVTKIGYPDRWRDYGALRIERDDLWGNVVRANEFEFHRQVSRLDQPVDRQEWLMTPQTVNAYYNPPMNEIVFPAAILQPPFFNAQADDAVNYGAIGAVIGHEISHGFDDEGSQYDADGNLRDWFAPEDHAKFAAKTRALVAQYDQYSPVPGFHVNGQLTLGENIADNAGLSIAYQAYHLSLDGREGPVIEGLTADQRFYYGFVRVWRGKIREADAIRRIKVDPHSPAEVRGTAPLRNQAGFYPAFDVKPGDRMYLPPEQRVHIW